MAIIGSVKIVAGIRSAYASAKVSAGVYRVVSAPMRMGIADTVVSPPVNPVGVHIGGGVVLLSWEWPTAGATNHFIIFASLSQNGTYTQYAGAEFYSTGGVLYNAPIGQNLYLKVCTVAHDGAISSPVAVKRGKVNKPTVTLKVTAVRGSMIPAGELFVAETPHDRLIGVVADNDIYITE